MEWNEKQLMQCRVKPDNFFVQPQASSLKLDSCFQETAPFSSNLLKSAAEH